jgi:hypothetical protein
MAPTTYFDVITKLNSCSLRQSLELVSLLSAVEYHDGHNSPISSLLHSETVRLLAEAIIKSKAAWYKEQRIELSDLPELVNGANEALHDKRLAEIRSGGERQEMLYKLQRYLSRLAYIQIRPQQTPFISLGRSLAILDVIPSQYRDELAPHLQDLASAFPATVQEALGLKVSDVVKTHLSLADYFGRVGFFHSRQLPSPREGRKFNSTQQAYLLRQLVAASESTRHLFRLTEDGFGEIAGEYGRQSLRKFAAIFGRQIHQLRDLFQLREFQAGPEGHRLSPLDRFPLITEEGGGAWYVPNVRGFVRSAPEILHFTLNETCREIYEALRGGLLEIYLRLMLETRAPHLKLIPEMRWMTRKGGVAGPDLLLIDHSDEPVVIAVEVKSRRMLPSTRYELLDEHLEKNYEDLWKAMERLPSKVSKIFSHAGDYQEYKEDLVRAERYPVYYLGVAGEAPFLFGELVEYRRRLDLEFPLYGFNELGGVMSVDSFERMVEVSVQKARPIVSVLREYLEDCKNLELSGDMAENFRHADLDEMAFFGCSFLEPFWPSSDASNVVQHP